MSWANDPWDASPQDLRRLCEAVGEIAVATHGFDSDYVHRLTIAELIAAAEGFVDGWGADKEYFFLPPEGMCTCSRCLHEREAREAESEANELRSQHDEFVHDVEELVERLRDRIRKETQ